MTQRNEEEIMGLEQHLTALAGAMTYPPTPDLASGFWRHLQASRETARPAVGLSFAGLAVAASVVVVSVLIGTVTPARDAAADLFDRIDIFQADEAAFEGVPEEFAGERVTLEEAEMRLGRPIPLPAYVENAEDRIAEVQVASVGHLTVVAVFIESPDVPPFVVYASNGFVGKGLGYGAEAESVSGFEDQAYWLEGRRIVEFYNDDGDLNREIRFVSNTNTLVFSLLGGIYKLEGNLEKDEAIAIAQSLE